MDLSEAPLFLEQTLGDISDILSKYFEKDDTLLEQELNKTIPYKIKSMYEAFVYLLLSFKWCEGRIWFGNWESGKFISEATKEQIQGYITQFMYQAIEEGYDELNEDKYKDLDQSAQDKIDTEYINLFGHWLREVVNKNPGVGLKQVVKKGRSLVDVIYDLLDHDVASEMFYDFFFDLFILWHDELNLFYSLDTQFYVKNFFDNLYDLDIEKYDIFGKDTIDYAASLSGLDEKKKILRLQQDAARLRQISVTPVITIRKDDKRRLRQLEEERRRYINTKIEVPKYRIVDYDPNSRAAEVLRMIAMKKKSSRSSSSGYSASGSSYQSSRSSSSSRSSKSSRSSLPSRKSSRTIYSEIKDDLPELTKEEIRREERLKEDIESATDDQQNIFILQSNVASFYKKLLSYGITDKKQANDDYKTFNKEYQNEPDFTLVTDVFIKYLLKSSYYFIIKKRDFVPYYRYPRLLELSIEDKNAIIDGGLDILFKRLDPNLRISKYQVKGKKTIGTTVNNLIKVIVKDNDYIKVFTTYAKEYLPELFP